MKLVGDIERMLGELILSHTLQQHSANSKVCPRALAFGDERIGRLMNTVVEERIGVLLAEDQPCASGLGERRVDLLFQFPLNHSKYGEVHHVPETSELLQGGL